MTQNSKADGTYSVLQIASMAQKGGITTHVRALRTRLSEAGVMNEVVGFRDFRLLVALFKYKIIHTHMMSPRARILAPLLKLVGKKVVLTLHGESLLEQLVQSRRGPVCYLQRLLLQKSVRFYDAIIVPHSKIREFLVSIHVNPAKIHEISAYISQESDWEYAEARPAMASWVAGRKIIFSSGDLRRVNGVLLYGFDLIIDYARRNISLQGEFAVVLALTGSPESAQIEKLRQEISSRGLDQFIYVNDDVLPSALSLIRDAYCVVRATASDGSALAISEALQLGVPVVASDAVPRAPSCLLFRNRDVTDLERAMNYLRENYEAVRLAIVPPSDGLQRTMELYESLSRR